MIGSLFTYETCMSMGDNDWPAIYKDVRLRVKIGDHEPGAKFDEAEVDYDSGSLTLRNDDKEVSSHILTISIAD